MNLLPDSRKSALTKLYMVRLSVVVVLLLSAVLLIHAVLTIPTTAYYYQLTQERTLLLSGLGEQLAGSGEREVSARVKALTDSALLLARTATGATGSGAIRSIVSMPHIGVRITGLSFARGGATDSVRRMTLVGTAVSREALRSYAAALGALPYVSTVDLPISAYAKEADINFTITLVGSFMP